MIPQTCIVMPGRFGDIINILPCARDIALKEGGKCAMVVTGEFASVLEGCSYVEPIIIQTHFTDMRPAIQAAGVLFSRVLVGKVNEKSVGVNTQCQSFNEESWRQLGYLERWRDLPLVFDQRSPAREKELVRRVCEATGAEADGARRVKPMVLANFTGKSAAFPHGKEIAAALHGHCQMIDLGNVVAERLYDLLGLMDTADLLITGDTSTLHLAAASRVPVVNLIGDKPTLWHGSKPRNNSVRCVRYTEMARTEQLTALRELVDEF